jgi:hypothetical protein
MNTRGTALLLSLAACASPPIEHGAPWQSLFDGEHVAPWTSVSFGGEGTVSIQDGRMVLEPGGPLTGVITDPHLPMAYELRLSAVRLLGNDFFCGLTFPVRGKHLTLILGGWGGAVCGLSSLDGQDAARNPTRTLRHFPNGIPVTVLLRVTQDRVTVDLDGRHFLAADLGGHELSLRAEMDPCVPLGFASFATRAALLSCEWRPL